MIEQHAVHRRWQWIGNINAAHVLMLRETELVDENAAAVLLKAIDICRQGRIPDSHAIFDLVAEFDERVDAITPAGYAGASTVGRGSVDVAATVVRGTLREDLLELDQKLHGARTALVEMATGHVVTLMPAYLDGRVAQPTSFGHWLGGTIGPIGRAAERLRFAYELTNLCPLGSGSLASSGMPIERERIATLLGFDGLIVNTFDAVSASDHFVAAVDAVHAIVAPIRRMLEEIVVWTRIEPESFLLSDDWTTLIGQLPQGRFPADLQASIAEARRIEADSNGVRTVAAALPHAPIAGALDVLIDMTASVVQCCTPFLEHVTALLRNGIVVNRALLANRAGKAFSTSSDLADFLMIEEELDPGSARNIAALAISRARDQGLEAAGITAELIDGAALLVIGRELKVEFEAISRYLAPRRFIERRTATGAPSPAATRAYLEAEQARLSEDANRHEEPVARHNRAGAELARLESEALAATHH